MKGVNDGLSDAALMHRLQAEIMRLRAAVIIRDTALAVLRDDYAALETSIPGLRKRRTLTQTVSDQAERLIALERERAQWQSWRHAPAVARKRRTIVPVVSVTSHAPLPAAAVFSAGLMAAETAAMPAPRPVNWVLPRGASLVVSDRASSAAAAPGSIDDVPQEMGDMLAADRVICQVACVTHHDYWRLDDHCTRSGKRCTLAEGEPSAGSDDSALSVSTFSGTGDPL